jgi:hypothetical protein
MEIDPYERDKTCEAGQTLQNGPQTKHPGRGVGNPSRGQARAIHSLREITNVFPKQVRNDRAAVVEWA